MSIRSPFRSLSLKLTLAFLLVGVIGAGLVAVLANFPRTLPTIVTLHETFYRELFRGPLGRLKRATIARLLTRVDRLIVVGQDAFDNLATNLPLPHTFLSASLAVLRDLARRTA